jgi:hypothetical protein
MLNVSVVSNKPRAVSKGLAKLTVGLVFILCGFVIATQIPVLGIQTSSAFYVSLGFAIAFITSGMVLAVEGAIENAAQSF